MTAGFQPSIPLRTDDLQGAYVLTKTFNENARQNVRMILLTGKGEKLTDIDFGCGLRAFLFDPAVDEEFGEVSIRDEIEEQLTTYAPYISISELDVSISEQTLQVLLKYVILPTNTTEQDLIEVGI